MPVLIQCLCTCMETTTVERFDPRNNRWSPVAPMGTRRKHLGVAVFQNMIYAVGGRDDTTELSSAERFNPQKNAWEPVVAMTSRRSGVGGRFYFLEINFTTNFALLVSFLSDFV